MRSLSNHIQRTYGYEGTSNLLKILDTRIHLRFKPLFLALLLFMLMAKWICEVFIAVLSLQISAILLKVIRSSHVVWVISLQVVKHMKVGLLAHHMGKHMVATHFVDLLHYYF